ncbi:17559_t:CDS:2 [Dentiscutata erythropus]|uniref:17559_t:CDS:1 n=1 Tax=Dentiscutata erythropus TaxID=1348616 RepID=A0A9N9BEF1_9GLOM|nr:17559_t:CDS:2 [Dentiscutata erythropus]
MKYVQFSVPGPIVSWALERSSLLLELTGPMEWTGPGLLQNYHRHKLNSVYAKHHKTNLFYAKLGIKQAYRIEV